VDKYHVWNKNTLIFLTELLVVIFSASFSNESRRKLSDFEVQVTAHRDKFF